ncbi:TraR/DksA C4-type zinc finger protein [Methylophaga nitratireducenticrescens]|uniref:TraR/DksA C4-type zinc finger protein n=1 Tax=Methylophaga nitratireducenticrescens TaxID=754476 RepID=UPI000CDC6DE0|nr:TraR/DksA C4-type zinc finger protein [Methylophaga nitratireducenticrescens]AUZ85797.1 conjugal transfer protein TraR [Methylophaga nitratireducenticrescens]AUZ85864.1 conjugal transfer protein TraR [Methylophaga nitratireducenticrescens]
MDDIDRAQRQEQMSRDIAIDAAKRRGVEIEQPDEEDGVRYCLDCGLEIPVQRLQARPESVRCVECKNIKDEKGKRFG